MLTVATCHAIPLSRQGTTRSSERSRRAARDNCEIRIAGRLTCGVILTTESSVDPVAAIHELETWWVAYADELVQYAALLTSRSDAHDVVADTFVRLAENPRPTIRHARAYLYRSVANTVRDEFRARSRRESRERRSADDELITADPSDIDVARAIRALSQQQRAAIYLTYWCDLSSDQAAEYMGIEAATVRRHLVRARSHLAEVLAREVVI